MIAGVKTGKGLFGQMSCLEVAPCGFDVVEFGGVFRLPFDPEPVGARLQYRAAPYPLIPADRVIASVTRRWNSR